jgi:hypothetical protein
LNRPTKLSPAVVYPISQPHADRIFLDRKDVFCKYTGKAIPKLKKGGTRFFYVSGGSLEIQGQAEIAFMEFLPPATILAKYGERLFITSKELSEYAGYRDLNQPLSVFLLNMIQKYYKPFRIYDKSTRIGKRMTTSGVLLNESEYSDITNISKRAP